jgi:hypothetical protein
MKRQVGWLLLICASLTVTAQNLSRNNVMKMTLRGTGPIIRDSQVEGYYQFYLADKEDKKNYNYQLSVYDANLTEIKSINIVRPKTFVLIEAAFNGEAFGFLFFDRKGKSVELMSYDKALKPVGLMKRVVSNRFSLALYDQIAQGSEPTQALLIPVNGKGFVYYGMKAGNKMHYQMEFMDNQMKTKWMETTPAGSKMAVDMAADGFQSDKYLGSVITSKKNLTTRNTESDLVVHDIETGKALFRSPMTAGEYSILFSDVWYDQANQRFTVFGEYFDIDDAELKARSLGFITVNYDMQGKMVGYKTNSWQNEISKAAPVNERGKFDGNNTNILFHDFIRTSDGKVFAVGEQYKKAASAAGIATTVLFGANSGTSTVQLNVYNMVVFEFESDYTLKKVHVFEKDKNVLLLPSGYGTLAPRTLSYYAKSVGGFDYSFSQMSPDKNTFYISYVNYDREKGEKSKNVLGTIVYTPEKQFTVDKVEMNRKSTLYFVQRAKDGYVFITEYFKKEKRIDSRLAKINY